MVLVSDKIINMIDQEKKSLKVLRLIMTRIKRDESKY